MRAVDPYCGFAGMWPSLPVSDAAACSDCAGCSRRLQVFSSLLPGSSTSSTLALHNTPFPCPSSVCLWRTPGRDKIATRLPVAPRTALRASEDSFLDDILKRIDKKGALLPGKRPQMHAQCHIVFADLTGHCAMICVQPQTTRARNRKCLKRSRRLSKQSGRCSGGVGVSE